MTPESYESRLEQLQRHRNVIVRNVRDAQGNRMGLVVEPHDGTEAGVIAAAQRATDRMYAEYPEASNIESRIAATDDSGRPKWAISPNFQHLAETRWKDTHRGPSAVYTRDNGSPFSRSSACAHRHRSGDSLAVGESAA
jgi:hypothetical protein